MQTGNRVCALVMIGMFISVGLTAPVYAQERPEASPEDVESPDAIVAAFYEAISNTEGERPNYDRWRSLFAPEARLIAADYNGSGNRRLYTVEEFIREQVENYPVKEESLIEREIHAVTERFGHIAHVFSTYESLRSPEGDPFQRGINSFQLWYDGDRWWIVQSMWFNEREGTRIPERYEG